MKMGTVIKRMLFTHYYLLYLIDSQNCPSLSLGASEKQTQTTYRALGSPELGVCFLKIPQAVSFMWAFLYHSTAYCIKLCTCTRCLDTH